MSRSKAWSEAGIEPSLTEVLGDPIVHLVMRRDGVSLDDVRAAVRLGQARLRAAANGDQERRRTAA